MAEIPNVTGRIAELRDVKRARSLKRPTAASFAPEGRDEVGPTLTPSQERPLRERAVARSYFTVGVYTLLFCALLGQLFFILLLDLL